LSLWPESEPAIRVIGWRPPLQTEVASVFPMMQTGHHTRLTLTVEEAAQLLGISRAFAYEAVRRGEISSITIGRRILVPKAALHRLVGATDEGAPS
jgi:excisionase family DNA binding protein